MRKGRIKKFVIMGVILLFVTLMLTVVPIWPVSKGSIEWVEFRYPNGDSYVTMEERTQHKWVTVLEKLMHKEWSE